MKRREFYKNAMLGVGSLAMIPKMVYAKSMHQHITVLPSKKVPLRKVDVVVVGGGTAGVVAAIASARTGAKTMLVEAKGYTGGTIVEGGTAIHSFYNVWKGFPGVKKRKVVRGIPSEIIDRLIDVGGTSGYPEMEKGYDYDSVCTAIDTELYKLITMRMLVEAGVHLAFNTWMSDVVMDKHRVSGIITHSHQGTEIIKAKSVIDCTAFGDVAVRAGAHYTEPNDYPVCNSMGLANVDIDKYYEFLNKYDAVSQYCEGTRSGVDDQIIRLSGKLVKLPRDFREALHKIGMSTTTTTIHDNYLMFIKCDYKMAVAASNRDETSKTEVIIRENMYKAVQLFKKYIPGCEKAFMARTSPALNTRRARWVECDYDITADDVVNARHFDDDVAVYGYHSRAPVIRIKNGGTYGIPYRALIVKGIDNLFVSGQMITSEQRAHLSTFSAACCMAEGQAAGTAAAICSKSNRNSREINYNQLRAILVRNGVYFES